MDTPDHEQLFIPAYMGIPTFMYCEHTRKLDGADFAVLGVPLDSGATSWRSGTRFGPRSIRENSLQVWGHNGRLQIAPTREFKVVDYGDVMVDATSVKRSAVAIQTTAGHILNSGTQLLSLGGDHSITAPLLQAHAEHFGPVAVIHFDSHTDTYKFHTDLEHGNPFYVAIQAGAIDTDAYIQVGIRGPQSDPNEVEEAESLGARVLTIETCFELGMPALVALMREHVGDRPVYISLDIDSIDPAYAPGTGTPEVGGFTSFQMLTLLRGLAGLNIVGADLVEVNPHYDSGAITSILGANLAFEQLSLMGLSKRSS
jgi:agmatinase/guanidinopropionase